MNEQSKRLAAVMVAFGLLLLVIGLATLEVLLGMGGHRFDGPSLRP